MRNVVWVTADVHYCAAHHYDPARAQFQDFEPFWEFVAGPLNAGSFGPGTLDNTFGRQAVFYKALPPGRGQLVALLGTAVFRRSQHRLPSAPDGGLAGPERYVGLHQDTGACAGLAAALRPRNGGLGCRPAAFVPGVRTAMFVEQPRRGTRNEANATRPASRASRPTCPFGPCAALLPRAAAYIGAQCLKSPQASPFTAEFILRPIFTPACDARKSNPAARRLRRGENG
ncbi:alkaline phosphatase D family protein [Methylibium sp.]|uniref:alkaline phosphatase D family protein n=1 Tax=Methylibium sp. TaxID=2067992 RepID=UPI0025F3FCCC|nr:alkaline phosphatase D family protein [Methylibium sp.]